MYKYKKLRKYSSDCHIFEFSTDDCRLDVSVGNNKMEYISKIDGTPNKDEEVILNYQFNLSRGALLFDDINEQLKVKLITLAKEVNDKIGLVFGSIDIILTTDNKLLVMEANSGVMMNNYIKQNGLEGKKVAYDIYKDAIELMFKE